MGPETWNIYNAHSSRQAGKLLLCIENDVIHPRTCTCTMSHPPGCKTQLYKRHVLADSGINLIHQRTIAVERFAVLDFHRSLPNARLQSDVLDSVIFNRA